MMFEFLVNTIIFSIFVYLLVSYLTHNSFSRDNIINIEIKNENKDNIDNNTKSITSVDWSGVTLSLKENKKITKENSIFIDDIRKARMEADVVARMYENKYKRIYEEINIGICSFDRDTGLINFANKHFINIYCDSKINNKRLEDFKNGIYIYDNIDTLYSYINKKKTSSNIVDFKLLNNRLIKVKIYTSPSLTEDNNVILFITDIDDEYRLNEKLRNNLNIIYNLFHGLDVELYLYHKNKGIIKIIDKNITNSLIDLINNEHEFVSIGYYFNDNFFINILNKSINKCFNIQESVTYNIKNDNKEVTVCMAPILNRTDILTIIVYPDNSKKHNYSKEITFSNIYSTNMLQ